MVKIIVDTRTKDASLVEAKLRLLAELGGLRVT